MSLRIAGHVGCALLLTGGAGANLFDFTKLAGGGLCATSGEPSAAMASMRIRSFKETKRDLEPRELLVVNVIIAPQN